MPVLAYGLTLTSPPLPGRLWQRSALTLVHDVLVPVEALAAVGQTGLGDVDGPEHTLVAQVAHEELEADEGEDAQAEDGEDHHIRELLHRLDQGANDGLQAWRAATHVGTQTWEYLLCPLPLPLMNGGCFIIFKFINLIEK